MEGQGILGSVGACFSGTKCGGVRWDELCWDIYRPDMTCPDMSCWDVSCQDMLCQDMYVVLKHRDGECFGISSKQLLA